MDRHLGPGRKKIPQRALAAPKIRNGKIGKIVVVESGAGYINPVAKVRGIAPRHGHYDDGVNRADHYESRIWMCGNLVRQEVESLSNVAILSGECIPRRTARGKWIRDFRGCGNRC